jgi:pyridoxal phosphate enzyme (YggS family)
VTNAVTRIAENLDRVRERMDAAARRSGRSGSEVRLCAVSKGRALPAVREAVAAGVTILGENRVQEGLAKIEAAQDLAGLVSWHLIGHLQRNKARRAADRFDLIQSVDSREIARRLSDLGLERGRPVRALAEVRTADDPTKTGLPAEDAEAILAELIAMPGLVLEGLMTMAPNTDDERRVRASFAALARLRDRLGLRELSMGMSGDYEVAIEEGATIVRVGSAIFG